MVKVSLVECKEVSLKKELERQLFQNIFKGFQNMKAEFISLKINLFSVQISIWSNLRLESNLMIEVKSCLRLKKEMTDDQQIFDTKWEMSDLKSWWSAFKMLVIRQ